ncbi:hypothetical protein [Streptomyces sp. NPDC002490]|uniref:8-oxoguanine DNA glycosylase OGG fold protein n=1 Tax=Streptomyces sp. NPDC002490 TaxID=3154416 RepID=UPI00332E620D
MDAGRTRGDGRQALADALDEEVRRHLLPPAAVDAIGVWLAGPGARYAAEGVGAHAVAYVPAHWSGAEPWLRGFAGREQTGAVRVSRARVTEAVRDAVGRGAWAEALVASYVWGQGRTGYGPHRLEAVLAEPGAEEALGAAVAELRERGAVAAYRGLRGTVRGLGPAFFTKFLYFLDLAEPAPVGPRALVLDQRVARVVRAWAQRVGAAAGVASAAGTAAWTWSDGGWTAHRYAVYLELMSAARAQLADAGVGAPAAGVDLVELAFFQGVWDPLLRTEGPGRRA